MRIFTTKYIENIFFYLLLYYNYLFPGSFPVTLNVQKGDEHKKVNIKNEEQSTSSSSFQKDEITSIKDYNIKIFDDNRGWRFTFYNFSYFNINFFNYHFACCYKS